MIWNKSPKISLLVFIFAAVPLFGQVQISSVKIIGDRISDVTSFDLGNSILVSYFEEDFKTTIKNHRGTIFYLNGQTENIYLKDIASQFCGVEQRDSTLYLYYFENKDKKSVSLKTLLFDQRKKIRKILDQQLAINGRVIGVIEKDGARVFSWKKPEKILVIYNVSKGSYTKNEYSLPENTSRLDAFDFQLIRPNTGWLYEANSRAKIYFENQHPVLSMDRADGTEIISFPSREKDFNLQFIPNDKGDSRSYLCDSLLFRLNMDSDGFTIRVFNSRNGSTVATKSFLKKDAQDSDKVYLHSGKDDLTLHTEKLKRMISVLDFGAEPAIVASRIGNGEYCITAGTFYNEKGVGFVPSLNPLAMLIGTALRTTIKQMRQGPSISRYFHSTFKNGTMDFKKDPSLIYKKIDDFDITKKKKTTIEDILIRNILSGFLILRDLKLNQLELIEIK